MGGDRDQLRAAARRARSAPAARADAVADAGAVRPARGAGGDRALPARSCARSGRESHRRDIEGCGRPATPALVAELERSAAEYAAAADAARARSSRTADCCRRSARHASWTSAATHAILPLLGDRRRHRAAAARPGSTSHRRRFGDWDGGFWLPECAHAPWLDAAARGGRRPRHLRRADRPRSGCGDRAPPAPAGHRRRPGAVADRPRDDRARLGRRAATRRAAAYRDYHRHTPTTTASGRNDGGTYDHDARSRAGARPTHATFVDRGRGRASRTAASACARSTPSCSATGGTRASLWLEAVLDEADAPGPGADHARRRARAPRAGRRRRRASARRSWGAGRRPAHLERRRRSPTSPGGPARAELRAAATARRPRPSARCASCWRCSRSDWAFLAHRDLAGRLPAGAGRCHAGTLRARSAGARTSWTPDAARTCAPTSAGGRATCPSRATPSGTSRGARASGSAAPARRRRPRSSGTSLVTTALVPITAVVADRDAAQDAGAVADPDVVADAARRACRCPARGSGARPRPCRGRSRSSSRGRR